MILLRYVVNRVATMTMTRILASAVESVLVYGGFKLTNGHVEFLIYQIYDLGLNLARIPNQILMILKRQTPIHVRTSNMKEFPNFIYSKLPGIKLPKSEDQWKEANEHFKTVLPYNSEIADIEDILVHTQKAIYQYFSEKYGCVNTNIFGGYSAIYGHLSKRQLKLKLRELKTAQYPREDEIKFVSGLLRSAQNTTQTRKKE